MSTGEQHERICAPYGRRRPGPQLVVRLGPGAPTPADGASQARSEGSISFARSTQKRRSTTSHCSAASRPRTLVPPTCPGRRLLRSRHGNIHRPEAVEEQHRRLQEAIGVASQVVRMHWQHR
jgi:hypothetical protein